MSTRDRVTSPTCFRTLISTAPDGHTMPSDTKMRLATLLGAVVQRSLGPAATPSFFILRSQRIRPRADGRRGPGTLTLDEEALVPADNSLWGRKEEPS